jgi:hypothetical protein
MAFDILHKHLIAVHFSVENQNYVNASTASKTISTKDECFGSDLGHAIILRGEKISAKGKKNNNT